MPDAARALLVDQTYALGEPRCGLGGIAVGRGTGEMQGGRMARDSPIRNALAPTPRFRLFYRNLCIMGRVRAAGNAGNPHIPR